MALGVRSRPKAVSCSVRAAASGSCASAASTASASVVRTASGRPSQAKPNSPAAKAAMARAAASGSAHAATTTGAVSASCSRASANSARARTAGGFVGSMAQAPNVPAPRLRCCSQPAMRATARASLWPQRPGPQPPAATMSATERTGRTGLAAKLRRLEPANTSTRGRAAGAPPRGLPLGPSGGYARLAHALGPSPGRAVALTRFHTRLLAEELTLRTGRGAERVLPTLFGARVDLHPHQVEAAAFALDSLGRGGCLLADEVGLGKTIEAGIVLSQLLAEGKERILILTPATLRAQWQAELREKFDVDSVVVDGRSRGTPHLFQRPFPVICSLPFAAARPEALEEVPWDVVVIDEAHRLRNAHRPGHKTGRALLRALKGRPKLLLTATPLQNDLLELFGLLSFLDVGLLGPEHAFRSRYTPGADGSLSGPASEELKQRLSASVHRTLRRQVREYVRFTNRRSVVEDFAPTAEEQALYEKVSAYLRRPDAAAIEKGQRPLLTLVYRKLLASSTFAIAPTLRKLAEALRTRSAATPEGLFEAEDLRAFQEEDEAWEDGASKPQTRAALDAEATELLGYAQDAERIHTNAKGEALKRALSRLFTVARAQQWPEKAVVFTESRRTQAYLSELLGAHGFSGPHFASLRGGGHARAAHGAGGGVPDADENPHLHRGRGGGPQPPILQPGGEL